MTVEVKIGVQNAARELSVETNAEPDTVLATLNQALKDDSLFTVTDSKGHTVAVPADKVAYLYFNADSGRKVGFGLTSA
ncbi:MULTISPECIES: DUF3107 domain-containing protein [Aeromicrobium]|uniref:DUF3107 domain-containing protein n=1 Tax=Aeromicrobium duanguangcaii TaxID=2968086 RepID=A0ABY5KFF2_9ACTN|nr:MULTISPECIES: DUF3107 domain-containing protein [Aeromicrobium]MCD9154734.1 DUF3107 domain-containing protein [Aeromicrobium duanguangcaii]MCL3838856.1 DUF3107 domain-containing protein [Aeromicrobium duanguangcaii]UUI67852.1 DUF3107 domain-containing protein [Aeromicrobium duanguangcaii]